MQFPSHRPHSTILGPKGSNHVRELFWHTFWRLILLYFAPLLLLAVFFHIQYRNLLQDGRRSRLEIIAEHQANTFDLFLRERLANLDNIIDDPTFAREERPGGLEAHLSSLQQTSDAFLDLGVVSPRGDLVLYQGPVTYTADVNYWNEEWFQELRTGAEPSVITEIYLGFRGRPHFTIAVARSRGDSFRVLRAALSPERLSDYLATLEGASEVQAAVVNARGTLQVATPRVGVALSESPFVPPGDAPRGLVRNAGPEGRLDYAFAWLKETHWALVVTNADGSAGSRTLGVPDPFFVTTLALFLLMGVVILVRTRQVVGMQLAVERHEAELSGQLVHAAKLASVGELAAGIAHEINNPLAIIAEEVGVLKDSLDPTLANDDPPPDLPEHLDAIHEAVFRCRDITRKLLAFVRHTDVSLTPQDLNDVLDEVTDLILGNELSISNVTLSKDQDQRIPEVMTDRNQLIQVFVNIVKNAMDAMPSGGRLTVSTYLRDGWVGASFRDTGCGMRQDQVERVFMPFFTTKEPGKGTGLGLSVSYTIIKNLGGEFYVESVPGSGSSFTVELPRMPGESGPQPGKEGNA